VGHGNHGDGSFIPSFVLSLRTRHAGMRSPVHHPPGVLLKGQFGTLGNHGDIGHDDILPPLAGSFPGSGKT